MATRMRNRERLLRKLAALPELARRDIGAAIQQGADEIVAAQKRLAPKKSGALARSIKATKGGQMPKYASVSSAGTASEGDKDLTVIISAGNSDVRYAHLVEFDTAPHENAGLFDGSDHPGTEAQPFFYPPYRAYRKRVKSRVTRATKKAARAVAAQ